MNNPVWRPKRSTAPPPAEEPQEAGRRFHWAVILAGILCPTAYAFVTFLGSGSGPPPSARAQERGPAEAAVSAPRATEIPIAPVAERGRRIPGELLSDLEEALDGGEDSSLVRLETSDQLGLFERLRDARKSGPVRPELTIERLGNRNGVQTIRISVGEVKGVMRIERDEGRWHVIGMAPAEEETGRS